MQQGVTTRWTRGLASSVDSDSHKGRRLLLNYQYYTSDTEPVHSYRSPSGQNTDLAVLIPLNSTCISQINRLIKNEITIDGETNGERESLFLPLQVFR